MVVPLYPYPVVGGLERQAHELSKSLLARGVGVIALSGSMSPHFTRREIVEGVPVYRVRWYSSRFTRAIATGMGLARMLVVLRTQYDVVHNHNNSWFGAFVIIMAKALRKPVLSKLPNVGEYGVPGIRARPLGGLCQAIFLSSDAIVAMSRDSIQELADVGFPMERVFATSNGIVPSEERPRQANGLLRVAFAGRLHEVKRVHDLLESWDQIVEGAKRPVELVVWGDGPQASELKEIASRTRHRILVSFPGHVSELREAMRTIDIFVLPSAAEGNSNAILEAMDAGVAIVSTRIGGTAMLVGADGDPFLFDVGDREALTQRLITLINNDEQRIKAGEAMRKRVSDHFAMHRVTDAYISTYDLLRSRQRTAVSGVPSSVMRNSREPLSVNVPR